MKALKVGKRIIYTIIVDDDDYDRLVDKNIRASDSKYYPTITIRLENGEIMLLSHYILDLEKNTKNAVRHRNDDRCDFRKENLMLNNTTGDIFTLPPKLISGEELLSIISDKDKFIEVIVNACQ